MAGDELTKLLVQSVVRIEIDDRPNGTGFFVAPAYVVTCAHVLAPLEASSTLASPRLKIVDRHGTSHPHVDIDWRHGVDLCLIKLGAGDTAVGVVLLNEAYEVGDEVFTYGFTENYPEGTPATFTVEGTVGSPTGFIKLKGGLAEPGMSGAPVLNKRSGGVCGVMKRSRDTTLDVGGYAIPTSMLYSAFELVPRQNASAHSGESAWVAQLTPDQRRLVLPRAGAVQSDYVEFVIAIGQTDEQWRVTATTYPDAGTVASIDVDLNCVRKEVPRLFRASKAHGRLEESDQARLLGRVLYRSILSNQVAQELERLAVQEKKPVHISLCFEHDMDEDLKHLPWEQLFVDGHGALGATQQLTLTRVMKPDPGLAPDPPDGGFAVLVVVGPGGGEPHEASVGVIEELKKLTGVEVLESGELTLDDVERRVREGGVTVLHYLGHGRYGGHDDEIAFSRGMHQEPEYVSSLQLADAMRVNPPRVVVLQTCSKGVVPADPTVLAPPLLNAGVEAVVAFQFPLDRRDAEESSKRLYEELASGHPIRAAVQQSRRKLTRPWSRAALFMDRPADIRLVGPVAQPPQRPPWGAPRG